MIRQGYFIICYANSIICLQSTSLVYLHNLIPIIIPMPSDKRSIFLALDLPLFVPVKTNLMDTQKLLLCMGCAILRRSCAEVRNWDTQL
ncbi:hypothetical protein GDO81_027971 [Engystomops pustulosus]|uniref:Uncharacterized protein n=1 Tax=Engystomops pustulosus TaxID=76066 RepID=A0AAV6ZNV7_ENGPU|nr:hypothetical protein GDO81_027971 [Engystomops pustulosus]